jgi:nucleoside-diphosphate-sugar epimerase
MNVLVTGNRGYLGSILTELLLAEGNTVTGLDTEFYRGCEVDNRKPDIRQITKDIRNISKEDLQNLDAIIHLAALSNDPLGELNPELTYDINFRATIRLAELAREADIQRFVFASSQSMYGVSRSGDELDEDASEKNPLTAYAKTKWLAECELKRLCTDDFTVVCFRPSTVFGKSPSLRCDIVFNSLVASAYTTGKIEIKSDGTPWRPVIHIRDVSRAFIAGLKAPKEIISCQSFNVGIKDGNFTIRNLAEVAQKVVEGSSIVYTGEHGSDSRTYKVSFKKILAALRDYYQPEWDLMRGGRELVNYFKEIQFTEEMFRGRQYNRLLQLKHLVRTGKADERLRWIS